MGLLGADRTDSNFPYDHPGNVHSMGGTCNTLMTMVDFTSLVDDTCAGGRGGSKGTPSRTGPSVPLQLSTQTCSGTTGLCDIHTAYGLM